MRQKKSLLFKKIFDIFKYGKFKPGSDGTFL